MNKNKIFGITLIYLGFIIVFYFFLIISIKYILSTATFPGIFVEKPFLKLPNGFEEINIDDGNGNNINGIFAYTGTGKTIYYFHGNGGPIDYFYGEMEYMNKLGYNVMSFDYPGYGKSTGFPTEKNISSYSDKFFKYISNEKNINEEDLILWGYSIGSAIALDFSLNHNFDKIILISPFSSLKDISNYYTKIPIFDFLLFEDSFVSKEIVKNISKDALIIHGNKDTIIPFDHGKKIYENFMGNKYLIELDNFGHNGIIIKYGNALEKIFKSFIGGKNLDFVNNYFFLGVDEIKKLEFENKIDLFTDDSIQKFVTSTLSFNDITYIPNDLEKISSKYIYDAKGGNQKLRKEAVVALNKLGKSFNEEFGKKVSIVSAYRSYDYQRGIKARGCPDNFCAKAGYSEHQTGLAVDFFEASTKDSWYGNKKLFTYYNWLVENAHLYGFHNTYQKGPLIDGYEVEPWHWRYLGVEFATYLHENNMTIAEYFYEYTSKKINNKG